MTMVVLGIVVAAVLFGVLALRGRGANASNLAPPPPAAPHPDDDINGPTLIGPHARAAVLPPKPADAVSAPTAPAAELAMVSCTCDGAVHGAMPPFGKLRRDGDTYVFEAASRVRAATSAGLESGEHASTIQSLGTVEMGNYTFRFEQAEIQAVEADGPRVTVRTPSATLTFEGYGAGSTRIGPWFRDHGLI